jgi:hypothetical protein
MSAALKLEVVDEELELPREPKCVTSAAALWQRLCRLCDREQLALAVCLETSTRGGGASCGRRRRPTQERVVIAFRSSGRVRVFDPCSEGGPLREVTGAHDLARYFDVVAGFSYVVVR